MLLVSSTVFHYHLLDSYVSAITGLEKGQIYISDKGLLSLFIVYSGLQCFRLVFFSLTQG